MVHQTQKFYKFPIQLRPLHIILWIMILVLAGSFISVQASPQASDIAATADTPELIVSGGVEDFVVLNGHIYWTYCAGDLLDFTTYIKTQPINDPSAVQTLLALNGTKCEGIRDLQADPIFLYYINSSKLVIEKRLFQNFGSPSSLHAFTKITAPNALALADDFVYWASRNNRINRVSIYGGAVTTVATTDSEPVDIAIDDAYIWYGTSTGVYRMGRHCTTPCSPTQVYPTSVKALYAASTTTPTTRSSVFWVTNASPNGVESYDCNVPGSSGCYHKTFTTGTANIDIDGVAASDQHVFWLEIDTVTYQSRMRRVLRSGGTVSTIVQPVAPNSGWLPAKMLLDDDSIYFRHNGVSRISQSAAALVWNIVYQKMEITQGIQNLYNQIPLVAKKQTYVRVYGTQFAGNDTVGVEAQLAGTRGGVPLPGSPLQPIRRPQILSTTSSWDRDDITTSWLFKLPPEWVTAGQTVLTATLDPRGIYDSSPSSSTPVSASFGNKPPVCLVALKVSTHGPTAYPSNPAWAFSVNAARNMLPVHDLWLYKQGTVLEEGFWPNWSPYEMPGDSNQLLRNIGFRDRVSDDPDECDNQGARTIYVGLIDDKVYTGTTLGAAFRDWDQQWIKFPPTGNLWGVNYAGWPIKDGEDTLAHELGHNFGRKHVDCPAGDPANPGPYPYEDDCVLGIEAGDATYYGFEPVKFEPIRPDEASDLMSYKTPKWTSDYTWGAFRSANTASGSPANDSLAAATNMVYLTGRVHPDNPVSGELDYAWVLPTDSMSQGMRKEWSEIYTQGIAASDTNSANAVRYHVQFVGLLNNVLQDVDISLTEAITEETSEPYQSFELVAPAPSSLVTRLRLMADNTILTTASWGIFPPQVSILQPAGGELVDSSLTVTWEASDPNGDTLHFIIQYSPDNGAHWYALVTDRAGDPGETGYSVTLDSSALPGSNGQNALVRVIASDGYYTALADSNPFSVVSRAPDPTILSPASGTWYDPGQTIPLQGTATDPEDGHLESSALSWKIGTTNFGSGDDLQVEGLAPGNYTAYLRADDSDGQHTTVQAPFSVAPLRVNPGSARLDGYCNDVDYANSPMVQLKPYSDGTQASMVTTRNDDYLWVCFSGLKNQGPSSPGAFAGIRLDRDYSRDTFAQQFDFGFFIRQDGSQFTTSGNGSGGFGNPAPSFVDYSLATRTRSNPGGTTWNAEMRIQFKTAALGDHMGIDAAHYWVNWQGNDYHWPYTAQYNRPYTWAEGYFNRTPQLTEVSPDQATLPITALGFSLTGVDFKNGDEILWDGQAVFSLYSNPTSLTGIVGSALLSPGEHQVRVRSGNAPAIVSNPLTIMVNNPTPTLDELVPEIAFTNRGPLAVDIYGSGFVSGAKAYLDGVPYETQYFDSTHLRITLPASLFEHPSNRGLVVTNPSPTGGASNLLDFAVTQGYPIYLPLVIR